VRPFEGLTEIERRALAAVRELEPTTCSSLGSRLWGSGRGQSSCPFARQAGSILQRLRRRGYVETTRPIGATVTHWQLTEKGKGCT
jgi:hypothetical protein